MAKITALSLKDVMSIVCKELYAGMTLMNGVFYNGEEWESIVFFLRVPYAKLGVLPSDKEYKMLTVVSIEEPYPLVRDVTIDWGSPVGNVREWVKNFRETSYRIAVFIDMDGSIRRERIRSSAKEMEQDKIIHDEPAGHGGAN